MAPVPLKTFRPGDLITIIVRERRTWEAEADLERKTIEVAAPGGGFCLSSSNSIHSSVKPENYLAMVEMLREFGNYPIEA